LCPPCAKQALGPLGHWDGHHGCTVPAELRPLRLFKCRMWMWLVVPGLLDAQSGAHPVVAACGSAASPTRCARGDRPSRPVGTRLAARTGWRDGVPDGEDR
jgi:hypothetical protein